MAKWWHMYRLKWSVWRWNAWREANPNVQPYLRSADLHNADLRNANLSSAHLIAANLSHANLLSANLSHASRHVANLSGATLGNTVFQNVNLSTTLGLEDCYHLGPSTLDHRTLARSGPLPLAFLRGCGLSDWEIEATKLYQNSLSQQEIIDITYRIADLKTQNPIGYYSCFISYTEADKAFATHLYNKLQESGVRCWYAPEDIQAGKKLRDQIDGAIREHDKLLLVLSSDSVQSKWVEYELSRARRYERQENSRMLFPVGLIDYESLQDWECFDADEGRDLATEVREYFIPDFSNWRRDETAFDTSFDRLLHDLRGEPSAAS